MIEKHPGKRKRQTTSILLARKAKVHSMHSPVTEVVSRENLLFSFGLYKICSGVYIAKLLASYTTKFVMYKYMYQCMIVFRKFIIASLYIIVLLDLKI